VIVSQAGEYAAVLSRTEI